MNGTGQPRTHHTIPYWLPILMWSMNSERHRTTKTHHTVSHWLPILMWSMNSERHRTNKDTPYRILLVATTEWGKDVSKWPLIRFLDVINYLVHSPSAYTSEQLKKYKSLEAYKFYQDGWIRQILHKKIGELHLVLAKVITAR